MKTRTILAAIAAAILTVTHAFADTETVDGITWTYTVTDGKASVGGGSYSSPAVSTSTSGAITIPSTLGGCPVTGIRDYAFYSCKGLSSVEIPDSVTGENLGRYAFQYCTSLKSVKIGNGVTLVHYRDFYGCSSLESVTLGDSVEGIGEYAFYGCTSLKSITFPASMRKVWAHAFWGLENLETVDFNDGLETIEEYAFYNCSSLSSVTFPKSLKKIGNSAFTGCSALESVTIPDSVTQIGINAFKECFGLKSAIIGNGVAIINDYLFQNCTNLAYVTFPEHITSIGSLAFMNCFSLTSVTIPNEVERIGGNAFYNCSSLTSATIPASVTSIGNNAFRYCSNLTCLTLLGDVFDGYANLSWDNVIIVYYLPEYGENWFPIFDSHEIEARIPLGEGVASVQSEVVDGRTWRFYLDGNGAVICSRQWGESVDPVEDGARLVIPETLGGCPVVGIGLAAFAGMDGIASVVLPGSLTNIAEFAFSGCRRLRYLVLTSSGCGDVANTAFSGVNPNVIAYVPDNATGFGPEWNGFAVKSAGNITEDSDAPWDLQFNRPSGWGASLFLAIERAPTTSCTRIPAGNGILFRYSFRDAWANADVPPIVTNTLYVTGPNGANSCQLTSLMSSGHATQSALVAPPILQNLAPGEYTVTLALDEPRCIRETNYANNTNSVTIEIVPSSSITFMLANGEIVTMNLESGGTYGPLPVAPERPGCEFLGWFTAEDGGEQVTEDSIVPDTPTTLYAHWFEIPAKFRWDNVGGKCYTTPVKTQTGSTDRSYAYAAMDCLETMRLIAKGYPDGKDWNALTDKEKLASIGPANAMADRAMQSHGPVSWYDHNLETPAITKSLDWMLKEGFDGHRVVDLSLGYFFTEDSAFDDDDYDDWDDGDDDGEGNDPEAKRRRTIDAIKLRIMDKPLLARYQHVDEYHANGPYYYYPDPENARTYVDHPAYYRTELIIGFDDTVPASCFCAEKGTFTEEVPPGDGAWIVKGSYGTSYGDDGYYYISYYDHNLFSFNNGLGYDVGDYSYEISVEEDGQYGDFYSLHIDTPGYFTPTFANSSLGFYLSNIFTAESTAVINAVGIFTMNTARSPQIWAYLYPAEGDDTPGRWVESMTAPSFDIGGYHVVPLEHPFEVKEGQRFAIVVRADGLGMLHNPNAQPGQCLIARDYGDGSALEWYDFAIEPYFDEYFMGDGYTDWDLVPNTAFITAYTAVDSVDSVELEASDGTVEDGIFVQWRANLANGREAESYDLYRSEAEDGEYECIAPSLASSFFTDTTAKPDVTNWYCVVARVSGKEVESNIDDGFWSPPPKLEKVEPAELWLTGRGPYNVRLTWNHYNRDIYKIGDADFRMTHTEKTGMEYKATAEDAGGDEDVVVKDLFRQVGIPPDNHGKYNMEVKWNYTNLKSGVKRDGEPKEDITVKVFFRKYKREAGRNDIANWYWHWPEDGAIEAKYFGMAIYDKIDSSQRHRFNDAKFYYNNAQFPKGRGKTIVEPCRHRGTTEANPKCWDSYTKVSENGRRKILQCNSTVAHFFMTDLGAAIGDRITHDRYSGYHGPDVGEESKGLQKVADLIEHEMRHFANHANLFEGKYILFEEGWSSSRIEFRDWSIWAQREGGEEDAFLLEDRFAGRWVVDSDDDGLSDDFENMLGLSIGLAAWDPDTFGIRAFSMEYATTGDNEFLARLAESDDTVKIDEKKDWAFPGCQIAQEYQGHQNTPNSGYPYWGWLEFFIMDELQNKYGSSDSANRALKASSPRDAASTPTGGNDAEDLGNTDAVSSGPLAAYYSPSGDNVIPDVLAVVSVGRGTGRDRDANGVFAALGFPVVVTNLTDSEQECLIRGYLLDGASNAVAWATTSVEVPAHCVLTKDLLFAGLDVNCRSGVSGFTLARVDLEPFESLYGADYDVAEVMVPTETAYSGDDFTAPDARLDFGQTSERLDEDGLSVRFAIDVRTTNELCLAAILSDTNGQFVASASVPVPAGADAVEVTFPAEQIAYSGGGGPFVVSLVQVLCGGDVVCGGRNVHTTGAYAAGDFQDERSALSFDASSLRCEESPDGRSVTFSLDVTNGGADSAVYCLQAFVDGADGEYAFCLTTNVTLSAGMQSISFQMSSVANANASAQTLHIREIVFTPYSFTASHFRQRFIAPLIEFQTNTDEPLPVHRFYSKAYKGHFFTISEAEKQNLIDTNPNWRYEGAAYRAYTNEAAGTTALYRFYSKGYRGHFFTIDANEAESVKQNPNWKYEGVAYYVYPDEVEGSVPVFRFWSKGYRHHFYTTDEAEKDNLIATNPNWKYEGIAFYALPVPEGGKEKAAAPSAKEAAPSAKGAADGSRNALASPQTAVAKAAWTLSAKDGAAVAVLGTTEIGGVIVETRADAPDADEFSACTGVSASLPDPAVLKLTLPTGSFGATLWSATEGTVSDETAEGSFDFALPASGVWHWLRVRDEKETDAFSLWLRATAD